MVKLKKVSVTTSGAEFSRVTLLPADGAPPRVRKGWKLNCCWRLEDFNTVLCIERPKLQVYAHVPKCIRKPLSFLIARTSFGKWYALQITPQFFKSGALIEEYLMLNFKFVGNGGKKGLVLCFAKFFTLCFLRISSFSFGSCSLGSWKQETCFRVGKGYCGNAALHSYTLIVLWVDNGFSLGMYFKDCETLLSELIKFVFFE